MNEPENFIRTWTNNNLLFSILWIWVATLCFLGSALFITVLRWTLTITLFSGRYP